MRSRCLSRSQTWCSRYDFTTSYCLWVLSFQSAQKCHRRLAPWNCTWPPLLQPLWQMAARMLYIGPPICDAVQLSCHPVYILYKDQHPVGDLRGSIWSMDWRMQSVDWSCRYWVKAWWAIVSAWDSGWDTLEKTFRDLTAIQGVLKSKASPLNRAALMLLLALFLQRLPWCVSYVARRLSWPASCVSMS